jgi:hypothetical protein
MQGQRRCEGKWGHYIPDLTDFDKKSSRGNSGSQAGPVWLGRGVEATKWVIQVIYLPLYIFKRTGV